MPRGVVGWVLKGHNRQVVVRDAQQSDESAEHPPTRSPVRNPASVDATAGIGASKRRQASYK